MVAMRGNGRAVETDQKCRSGHGAAMLIPEGISVGFATDLERPLAHAEI
jgi:hypothetical protein